jgi:predicted small lipoprotein YifL
MRFQMRLIPLFMVLALAACGADGPPVAPAAPVAKTEGITITGEVAVGVRTFNP